MRELNLLVWWRSLLALPHDSRAKTLIIAALVALTSVAAVLATALALKPTQQASVEREQLGRKEEFVAPPGLDHILRELGANSIKTRLVDLETGLFAADIDPAGYDQRAAASDPAQSIALPREADIAGISRRARLAPLHILQRDGKFTYVALPVYGRGYQSIISAYLVLQADLRTIAALTILEHGDTPGIGSRIEDADWLELWRGKEIADETGTIRISVVRRAGTPYEVDGISGATRTTNGIVNMLRFWLGDHGFGPFLAALRSGKASP